MAWHSLPVAKTFAALRAERNGLSSLVVGIGVAMLLLVEIEKRIAAAFR